MAAAGFSACDDNTDLPPMFIPGQNLDIPAATASILDLKESFYRPSVNDYATKVPLKDATTGERWIISGTIVSLDKEGNIYKNIMIEDGTAGLTISVNKSKLYENYKPGQKLTIDCTDLYMGAYGNCMQLGYKPLEGKLYPGRIEENVFDSQSWVHGVPYIVTPQVVTIPEINAAKGVKDEFLAMQSRYVILEDMEFTDPGEQIAEYGSSTSRYAIDADGNKIQLYNSGYSTFWMYGLPTGKGNISGILSYHNRDWQILLISLNSIQGFPGKLVPVKPIFAESFATSQGDFTIENEELPAALAYVWKSDPSYKCMKASAFANSTNYRTSSYLVSPVIDLNGYSEVTASFEQACNYYASAEAAKAESTFEIRVDGGEWEVLEVPNFPTTLSWTFQASGAIDLSPYIGHSVEVAFHYQSDTKAGTWEVKNLKIKGYR